MLRRGPEDFQPICCVDSGRQVWSSFKQCRTCFQGGVNVTCPSAGRAGRAQPTSTGAWALGSEYVYRLDLGLASAISEVVANDSVVESGAGLGCYAAALLDSKVNLVAAYDGAPQVGELTRGLVEQADFVSPGSRRMAFAKWAFSLEVGEHLPIDTEAHFLDMLAAHATDGWILSWSNTFGNGHVNSRDERYIEYRANQRGFISDRIATRRLRHAALIPWFQQSVTVFRRDAASAWTAYTKQKERLMQAVLDPPHGMPPSCDSFALAQARSFKLRCGTCCQAPDDLESDLCQNGNVHGLFCNTSAAEVRAQCARDRACIGYIEISGAAARRRRATGGQVCRALQQSKIGLPVFLPV